MMERDARPASFVRLGPMGLEDLGLELGRLRCPPPARVKALRQDLGRNGQLSPLVGRVTPTGEVELLDGFKRVRAARQLGWTTLDVGCLEASTELSLSLMLSLNRRFGLSPVEEALVVQELVASGLTGVEVAGLLGRHKSWVSRRLGLLERLAPELQEEMKLGLLDAGVARRLLGLPRGNQVELAAVVCRAGLGARQTERLVRLWRDAPSEEARQHVLAHPKEVLATSSATTSQAVLDPRLSERGQWLARRLHQAFEVMGRLEDMLKGSIPPEERPLLAQAIDGLRRRMKRVQSLLGRDDAGES